MRNACYEMDVILHLAKLITFRFAQGNAFGIMNAEAFCKITQQSCSYITKSEALCNRLSFA